MAEEKPAYYLPTPRPRLQAAFVEHSAYDIAKTSFVIGCADVIPIDQERQVIFLALRNHTPYRGWCWIGGRLFPGEPEGEGIARSFKRETGLDLDPERFQYRCHKRYFFYREGSSGSGEDMFAYCFTVELTEDELAQAARNLDPREYLLEAGLREFNREQLVKENVHQGLIDFYDLLFPPPCVPAL